MTAFRRRLSESEIERVFGLCGEPAEGRRGEYTTDIGCYNAPANPKLPIGTCRTPNSAAALPSAGSSLSADFYFSWSVGVFHRMYTHNANRSMFGSDAEE